MKYSTSHVNLLGYSHVIQQHQSCLDEPEHYEFGLLCLKQLLSHQWCQGLDQGQKDDIYNLLPELDLGPDGLTEAGLHGRVDSFTYLTDTILTTNLGKNKGLVRLNMVQGKMKVRRKRIKNEGRVSPDTELAGYPAFFCWISCIRLLFFI